MFPPKLLAESQQESSLDLQCLLLKLGWHGVLPGAFSGRQREGPFLPWSLQAPAGRLSSSWVSSLLRLPSSLLVLHTSSTPSPAHLATFGVYGSDSAPVMQLSLSSGLSVAFVTSSVDSANGPERLVKPELSPPRSESPPQKKSPRGSTAETPCASLSSKVAFADAKRERTSHLWSTPSFFSPCLPVHYSC